jgi:hypothetical protein
LPLTEAKAEQEQKGEDFLREGPDYPSKSLIYLVGAQGLKPFDQLNQ